MANALKELEEEVHVLDLEQRKYQLLKGKAMAKAEWEEYKAKQDEAKSPPKKDEPKGFTAAQLKQIQEMFKK